MQHGRFPSSVLAPACAARVRPGGAGADAPTYSHTLPWGAAVPPGPAGPEEVLPLVQGLGSMSWSPSAADGLRVPQSQDVLA